MGSGHSRFFSRFTETGEFSQQGGFWEPMRNKGDTMGDVSLDRDKLSTEETYLIAPCGIYCGACDRFLGKRNNLEQELHRIIDGFNIVDVAPFMGIEQERMVEFLNILEKLSHAAKCTGCLGGGGLPTCPIRACSQEQGFLTCSECDEMPCNRSQEVNVSWDMVTKRYANWNIKNLERVREIGYRKFVDRMQEKVRNGFMTSDVISREMVVTEAMKKMQDRDK